MNPLHYWDNMAARNEKSRMEFPDWRWFGLAFYLSLLISTIGLMMSLMMLFMDQGTILTVVGLCLFGSMVLIGLCVEGATE